MVSGGGGGIKEFILAKVIFEKQSRCPYFSENSNFFFGVGPFFFGGVWVFVLEENENLDLGKIKNPERYHFSTF